MDVSPSLDGSSSALGLCHHRNEKGFSRPCVPHAVHLADVCSLALLPKNKESMPGTYHNVQLVSAFIKNKILCCSSKNNESPLKTSLDLFLGLDKKNLHRAFVLPSSREKVET